MSSNVCTVWNRRPGDVGLYLRIGIAVILEVASSPFPVARQCCSGHWKPATGNALGSLQEFGDLFPFAQLHVGLLPVRALADEAPLPLELAVRDRGPHRFDLRAEQLLDRALDVDLGGAAGDLEHEGAAGFTQQRGLLGDQRAANDVRELHASDSCSFSIASRVAMIFVVSITSRAVTRLLATRDRPAILRALSAKSSCRVTSMISVLPVAPSRFSSCTVALVFFSLASSFSTITSAPSCAFCASAAISAPRRTFFGRSNS